jgi:hypothetical protein
VPYARHSSFTVLPRNGLFGNEAINPSAISGPQVAGTEKREYFHSISIIKKITVTF